MGQPLPDSLTQAALAGVGPLTIKHPITPVIILTTNVFGENRDSARVAIYFGSVMMYSVAVTQALPQAILPFDIASGGTKIDKGGFFF